MSTLDEHDTLPPSMDPQQGREFIPAPTDFFGVVKRLGPGLIIAGSIVGSGELIATTKTGAQAGISLLWLIIVGCLIKVFVQIELGRFAISHGETTLAALDQVPGPRWKVNWILWFWLFMTLASVGQLGGIVGGVGYAMAISFPLKGDYAEAIRMPSKDELKRWTDDDDELLSQWDLIRFQRKDADVDAEAAPKLGEAEQAWLAHADVQTGRLLDRLPAERRDPLVAKSNDLRSARNNLEVERRKPGVLPEDLQLTLQLLRTQSTELAAQIEAANIALTAAATATAPDDTTLKDAAEKSDHELRRMLRGHAVLSTQLAELDVDDARATRAVVAILALKQAGSNLAKAQAAFASTAKDGDDATARAPLELAMKEAAQAESAVNALVEPGTLDDKYWAIAVTAVTCILLYRGRYGLIQNLSTALVVGFTFITIGNVIALQSEQQWRISAAQIVQGLSFRLPATGSGLATALATFGIIGVGASELIAYPYWCLEKGYAKFTGPRTDDEGWAERARGWLRVMRVDAFLSMVIYTAATLAFYFMGVAVLHNEARDPEGMRMVSTLATAYVPVFGEYARWLFLIGAFAVLYSTFLVANAGNARMVTDGLKLFGFVDKHRQSTHDRTLSIMSVVMPMLCLAFFLSGVNPVTLVLIAGAMQATMLPMIGFGAIFFRYRMTDPRVAPSRLWDVCLIVSFVGLLIAGLWGIYSQVEKLF